jgi:hypothetical protein
MQGESCCATGCRTSDCSCWHAMLQLCGGVSCMQFSPCYSLLAICCERVPAFVVSDIAMIRLMTCHSTLQQVTLVVVLV